MPWSTDLQSRGGGEGGGTSLYPPCPTLALESQNQRLGNMHLSLFISGSDGNGMSTLNPPSPADDTDISGKYPLRLFITNSTLDDYVS